MVRHVCLTCLLFVIFTLKCWNFKCQNLMTCKLSRNFNQLFAVETLKTCYMNTPTMSVWSSRYLQINSGKKLYLHNLSTKDNSQVQSAEGQFMIYFKKKIMTWSMILGFVVTVLQFLFDNQSHFTEVFNMWLLWPLHKILFEIICIWQMHPFPFLCSLAQFLYFPYSSFPFLFITK